MKKIINTAKQNPFDVIIPGILAIAIIAIVLCLTVFSNGIYIAHF